MNEREIQNQIVEYIRLIGGWATKVQSGSILKAYKNRDGINRMCRINLAEQGTSDIIGCLSGRCIAIEVKRDAKELARWERTQEIDAHSREQHHQQHLVRRAGGLTFAVCSLEELENDFRESNLIP